MPRIVRTLIDTSQGHGWLPSIIDIPSQTSVFIQNFPVAVIGDAYNIPMHDHPDPDIPPHPIFAIVGSPSVFVNNRPVLRDGDPLSCGDVADVLSIGPTPRVFANDSGATQGRGPAKGIGETTGYVIKRPILSYPKDVDLFYEVEPLNQTFKKGCPYTVNLLEVYTPIVEEDTNANFKNYPGPPMTSRSGADLPVYALASQREPINIQLEIQNPPPGFTFDPSTGKISGELSKDIGTWTTRIKAINFVGTSLPSTILFHGKRTNKCFNR